MIMRSTILARHRFRGPKARSPPHNRALRITPTHRHRADLTLEMIGVDRHVRVLQEHAESGFSLESVIGGLGEGARRQQEVLFVGLCQPDEEGIHHRLAVRAAILELLLAVQATLSDRGLMRVERPDLLDCLRGQRRLHLFRIDKISTQMTLILSSG